MKITPDQIRAARAMLRLEPHEVAERAHVPVSAVSEAEAPDGDRILGAATMEVVRGALERAGAEFIPDGVRRRRRVRPDAEQRFRTLEEISRRSAERLKGHKALTDDDLYDDRGLPV